MTNGMAAVKRILIITKLLLFFSCIYIYAQVKIHKNLSIEDGLIYSQVLFIHEDQRGYMWFGTSSGISRWDGLSFKNYMLPENLSDNNCKWIRENRDGALFFATRRGIIQYKDNHFSKIPNTPQTLNHWIHSLLMSSDDKLFIATDTSGLWLYDGRQFSNIKDGLPFKSVHALAEGTKGQIFIGIYANVIYEYNQGRLKRLEINGIPDEIEVITLFEDDRQALWIGTRDHGVYIFDRGSITRLYDKTGLPGSTVMHITGGEPNQVFIATDNGVAIIKNYQLHSVLNDKNGLSNNFVWYISRDRNGLYYIGTDGGGVDIYRPGLFQTINTDCGLPHNTVWTICETRNHDFYFGTDRGLAIYNRTDVKVIDTSSGLSDNMILCIYEASDGKIYTGTNEHGVDILYSGNIRNINSEQGLSGTSVWTITEDTNGLVYFGTYDGGINVWDGSRIIDTINLEDGLPTNAIVSSCRSTDGSLYFGTDDSGVFRLVNGKVDSLFMEGNTVWSIYEDALKNMYFGTNDRGLIYHREGKWDTLSINEGLSHNSILGILEDDQGKLYLAADNGLNIVEFKDDGCHIRIMGKSDGLASNECNQGAYYKDSQGYLWFGTVKGVSRFDPGLCKPTKTPPTLHLTKFKLFDKNLPFINKDVKYNFNYDENYFKFEFIGIDLIAPHKVNYKYRLSGIDQEWIKTNYPFIQYTNLDDGDYVLEIMAGNEWNLWSEPQQVFFKISPPFWETWWFILMSFLIIISPVVVVIRLRIQRILALERLRSKIAADLHDDIGAGLSEISILSAVAASKIPRDKKPVIETELNKIGTTARSLIGSMSDIVWLVNPKKDGFPDLISRLKDAFDDMLEAKGIIFSVDNTQTLQKTRLNMEYRQHLYMIIKEAIHNAIKYSEADKLQLSINLQGKILIVCIKDNGKGFDINRARPGNGLKNMKNRAEKIGGYLNITSGNGQGTQIEISSRV
ncbi:MAG: hypothetical protein JXR46_06030 [Calditrichaceae bacterium]|nr:hypothetical protein [Calditrichaceae bacterium]MBN2708584.1 hypothetical protein [Calditrichaceae bacterium]